MKSIFVFFLSLFVFGSASDAFSQYRSEEKQLWRTWSSMPDCSRAKTYKDDFGITWPTVEWARQEGYIEVYGKVSGSADLFQLVENTARFCAGIAAGAAGLAGYASGGAAAWTAFKGSFAICMRDANLGATITSLRIATGSRCLW